MKRNKLLLIVIIIIYSCGCQNSTTKVNVKNIEENSLGLITATQEYYFGVFAEKWDASALVGHAFIGIGKGTPLTCDINGNETEIWGFYPKKKVDGAKSYWFGPVDGNIASDVFTKIDRQFFIRIDFSDYLKIQLKVEEWKKKQYQLTRSDCISFLIDVCSTLPDRIKVPTRETTELPDDYVKKLIIQNN
ncbi:MAG TPA: hypothetical protein VHP32_06865 [Ignavibacteria bacterium]|nr:hypothetical protein [Ignavibacteria bacterium]